jgi:hypothetical protein
MIGFRVSGFQGFRVSGFQSFRVSGFSPARGGIWVEMMDCDDFISPVRGGIWVVLGLKPGFMLVCWIPALKRRVIHYRRFA